MTISEAQVRALTEDGFVIVDEILTPAQVDRALAAMKRVYRGEYTRDIRPPAVRQGIAPFGTDASVRWMLNARVLDGDVWDIATDPRLGEMAATLLRTPSVSIVEDQLLDKPPNSVPVNVHQDYSYWRFSTSTEMLTCWIALCDMTADLGPLELLRGSHRWGAAPRPKDLIVGSEADWLKGLEGTPAPASPSFAQVVVPAGGGVFFHGLTFHGSRANKTDRWRRAMSLHWASEECRVDRSKLTDYDYPYFFSRLEDGGRIVNKYMPQVHPKPG